MSFHPVPFNTQKADLLLLNPDFSKNELGTASAPENHLGLNRLAGYLAECGHIVQIIDTTGLPASCTGPEELGDWLLNHAGDYRVIGFHVNSWNINHILRAIDRALPKLEQKRILFGGPLASSEPEKLTQLFIDHGLQNIGLVQGLGEKITDKILNRDDLLSIESLWAFEKGQFKRGQKITLTPEEFSHTPFLNLEHNTFYQRYYRPVIESGNLGDHAMDIIFSSQGLDVNRGCPFNCTYCSVPQYEQKLITYTPKRVVDELEYLAKEAGFFMFTFTNSNIMFYEPAWIREFCREVIGRGMNDYLNWTAYHHPSILARLETSDYHLMRKAGSDTIVFGVQSFDEAICRLFMRPKNTRELTEIIRQKTRESRQELTVDYITGVPGENLDIVEEAFHYFIENDIECRNYQLKFYPNTKLPTMNLDLSQHELVPITGDLAPELEAYAIIPKHANPRSAKLDTLIREHSIRVAKNRPVRLGKYIIESTEQARQLIEEEIPENPNIPEKVKRAMSIALRAMLSPHKPQKSITDLDPAEMMKVVIIAGSDAPPMVLAMQQKLRRELGEERFEALQRKYD
ncbi:hypothetical protein COY07_02190 [Candidatus Peregrinibacteria bacterium CG_4_10_14_0_2_um_filter_43_11]|nr:MAG: hypothetical protein COY07_02190 [Candidatus Peregrinibacteria bacterium CG_4_10_14_0_2_um_filter_43_11]